MLQKGFVEVSRRVAMRQMLMIGCLLPVLFAPLRPVRPRLADPIPPGYHEVGRFDCQGKHHVIFSNGPRWRWYVNGRFDCEGPKDQVWVPVAP